MDWTRYLNFSAAEFACPCCGVSDMDPDFMHSLQALRGDLGFPFKINSGYRCVESELAKGRSGKGAHPQGRGADIAAVGDRALLIIERARSHGMTGVGVKQHGDGRFVHLDNLPGTSEQTRPWIWSYE